MARRSQKRGGYQPPANPAGASGPGAASQRTDGRPSDLAQRAIAASRPQPAVPMQVPNDLPYGGRTAVEGVQALADQAINAAAANAAEFDPTSAPAAMFDPGSLIGPPEDPSVPMTAGLPFGPGPGPDVGKAAGLLPADPDEIIRVMYAASGGHPDILDLLGQI